MNKLQLTIIVLILLCLSPLVAAWNLLENNPAILATEQGITFTVPGFSNQFSADNTLMRIDDLIIFDKKRIDNGHILSSYERNILTAKDLNFSIGMKANILEMSYKNFRFSMNAYAIGKVNVLDKGFTKVIIEGNETNIPYSFDTGKNSGGYSFTKTSFDYAWPKAINLEDKFDPFNNEPFNNELLNTILNPTIYLGGRLNLYNSINYAKVTESRIEFGSMEDSLYYDYYLRYIYTSGKPKSNLSLGLGFGAIAEYDRATVFVNLDDIFTKLYYENLKGADYQGQFGDSLLYFHGDDYDPFNEDNENDSLRVARKSVKINPSIEFGVQSNIWRSLELTLKYQYSDYQMANHFSLTSDYTLGKMWPLRMVMGYDDQMYYTFAGGISSKRVDFYLGTTFYHGLFRYLRGIGFETGLKIKI